MPGRRPDRPFDLADLDRFVLTGREMRNGCNGFRARSRCARVNDHPPRIADHRPQPRLAGAATRRRGTGAPSCGHPAVSAAGCAAPSSTSSARAVPTVARSSRPSPAAAPMAAAAKIAAAVVRFRISGRRPFGWRNTRPAPMKPMPTSAPCSAVGAPCTASTPTIRSTRRRRPGTLPASTNSRQQHKPPIRLAGALMRPRPALPAAPAGAPGFPGCPRDHAGHLPSPGSSAGKGQP